MDDSQMETMEVDPPEVTSSEKCNAKVDEISKMEEDTQRKNTSVDHNALCEKDDRLKDLEVEGEQDSGKNCRTVNESKTDGVELPSSSETVVESETARNTVVSVNENAVLDCVTNSDDVNSDVNKGACNVSVSQSKDVTQNDTILNSKSVVTENQGGEENETESQRNENEAENQGNENEAENQGNENEAENQGNENEAENQGNEENQRDKENEAGKDHDESSPSSSRDTTVHSPEQHSEDTLGINMSEKEGNQSTNSNSDDSVIEADVSAETTVIEDCEVMEVEIDEGDGKEGSCKGRKSENKDEEDIVELPVYKKPAEVVDLAIEDEVDSGDPDKPSDKNSNSEESNTEGNSRRIKLRSLASLVDSRSGEPSNVLVPSSHPDTPAIGEIVEHGVIIGSDEMGGLQLRISNVVGGEDCITGLSLDEDRDSFSNIQISSVTTLMDPMSPEDPNLVKDGSATKPSENESVEKGSSDTQTASEVSDADKTVGSNTESEKDSSEEANTGEIKIVNSESLSGQESDAKDAEKSTESGGPKIRLSSAVSEVAKDTGTNDEAASPPKCVYHVLRSILTMNRECVMCGKTVRCEFRILKKNVSGSWAFLCGTECRGKWMSSLRSDHVVEKPRLIFEKMCGMCGKDLANISRSGQYSWETREFCTKKCLTSHLYEVAGECHTCHEKVRCIFIGKYCVRFGSDIHQFCSNTCLERYKTKIKVCCYCQKNLEKVEKVTSLASKEYCSMKCLKRAQRRDIGQQNYSEHHICTVCQATGSNRYEFLTNQESYQLCSDPCLNVYKYVNKVKAVSCCLCFRILNAEDVGHYLYHGGHQLRVFCSDSCVNVFILSARKIVVCDTCKVKKYNFDMIHRQVDEDFRDYFYCSLNCLNTREQNIGKKNNSCGDVSSTTTTTNSTTVASNNADAPVTSCNMCSAVAKAQYHMVMSDNTLRSFCRYACATKYKNTFGFQVNGIQTTESAKASYALPAIRPKPASQLTTNVPQESETVPQSKKNAVNDVAQEVTSGDEQTLQNSQLPPAAAELLRLLSPPTMVNRMTSCRPSTLTKGVYCRPHPWHRQTQTESSGVNCSLFTSEPPPVLPVPVPVYVPSPMMMYHAPYPVPLFIPIPLPVPVFIPTTAKTSDDIRVMMKKIQEEMPSDPYEAEMLLLARASSENAESEARNEQTENVPLTNLSENDDQGAEVSSLDNFTMYSGEVENDFSCIDVSCLSTIEEDLPRYPLRVFDDVEASSNCSSVPNDVDSQGESKGKRLAPIGSLGRPRKRLRRGDSNDSQSVSDPDDPDPDPEPEPDPDPEPLLEEEFQGPYLNMLNLMAFNGDVIL